MSQSNTKPVLNFREWNTSSVMYMAPKVNDRGGKSINLISTQTKRSLHLSTPLMMTWGINDFVDDKGESEGKYSISLQFPNDDYNTKDTDDFLQKLKDFENQILDDAVRNSEKWWGDEISRDVVKHTYFPFLKYSKNKETKKVDYTKPPAIRAKVPFYDGKWAVEIYNTNSELIFPCSNDMLSPVDFVQKMSNVACVIQCTGIWIGGKGWGLTWKMIQCVVKPREIVSVYGRCHVELSSDDVKNMDTVPKITDGDDEEEVVMAKLPSKSAATVSSTLVEDSDDDEPVEVVPVVQKKVDVPPPAPVVVAAPPAAAVVPPSEPVKKKVVKKKVEA